MDELKFKQALEDRGLTWDQAEMVLEELDIHDDRGEQLREAERIIADMKDEVKRIKKEVSVIREILGRIAKAEEDDDLKDLECDLERVEDLLGWMNG